MPNILANIAKMDSATTGTGTLTLGAAVTGYLTFANAGVTNGQVVTYAIEDYDVSGNIIAREVGAGTYSSTGPTLTRDTVYSSTNAGAKINCSGLQYVFVSLAKEDLATFGVLSAVNTWTANNYFNGGNVGIGTTSPLSRLVVNTGTGNFDAFNGATGTISFGNGVASGTASPAIIGAASSSSALRLVGRSVDGLSSGDMSFDARPSAGGDFTTLTNPAFVFARFGTNLATILRNGNVGIGTTGPSSKLSVSDGTVRIDLSPFSGTTGYVGTQSNHPLGIITNNVEAIRVATNGRVGIGTTTPGATLELRNPSGAVDLRLTSVNTLYANIYASATDFSLMAVQSTPLVLGTANVQRVTIDASGNVGVGATSPKTRLQATAATTLNSPVLGSATNAPFYVTNNDTAYGLLAGTSTNGDVWLQAQRTDGTATAYNINLNPAGGRVGIGTASPDANMLLDVAGPIRSFSSTTNPSLFVVAPNTSAFPGSVVFQSYRTAATPPQAGDNIGFLDWRNHVYNAPARITVSASETHGATASGANIRFATCANGSATLTDRLYIRHDGCIGVNRIPDAGVAIDAQNVSGDTIVRALATNQRPVFLSEARQDTGYAPAFFTMRRHNVNATQTPSSVTIGELRWDGLTTGSAFTTFAGMRVDIGANSTTGAGGLLTFATATGTVTNDITDRLQLNSRGVLYITNDLGPDSADTLAVGFRGAPHNDQTGTTYTFARTDAGRAVMFKGTANATWTIPLSTTTDFPIGTMIIVDNSHFGSGTITVTVQGATGVGIRTTGAGEATTGRSNNKQVARGGVMTLRKLANRSATQSVTSITRVGTTATMTTPAAHGYIVGDFIEVAGAAQSQYNGTQRVLTATSTTLTYAMTADPGASASGTLTVRSADLWNATGNFTNVA